MPKLLNSRVRAKFHDHDNNGQKARSKAQRHSDCQEQKHAHQQNKRYGSDIHDVSPFRLLFLGIAKGGFVIGRLASWACLQMICTHMVQQIFQILDQRRFALIGVPVVNQV